MSLYRKLNQVAPVKSSAMSYKQRKTSEEKTNNVHVTNPNKIVAESPNLKKVEFYLQIKDDLQV